MMVTMVMMWGGGLDKMTGGRGKGCLPERDEKEEKPFCKRQDRIILFFLAVLTYNISAILVDCCPNLTSRTQKSLLCNGR